MTAQLYREASAELRNEPFVMSLRSPMIGGSGLVQTILLNQNLESKITGFNKKLEQFLSFMQGVVNRGLNVQEFCCKFKLQFKAGPMQPSRMKSKSV